MKKVPDIIKKKVFLKVEMTTENRHKRLIKRSYMSNYSHIDTKHAYQRTTCLPRIQIVPGFQNRLIKRKNQKKKKKKRKRNLQHQFNSIICFLLLNLH